VKKATGKNAQKALVTAVYPEIEGGRYPVKTETDRPLAVSAVVSGPASLEVDLLTREKTAGSREWSRLALRRGEATRWEGAAWFPRPGSYLYTVEARLPGTPSVRYRELEVLVEPVRARFAAWYEAFPRSQGTRPGVHGTLSDMAARLPDIRKMGFDVLYLTPIHPIGRTNRKGRNNGLHASPTDPGSPWSVGDATGGHTAIHPELGTLQDFHHLVRKAAGLGMEIALDFTSNCSPDHPWIREHPEWFFRNPDGTIRYAENPPKKYEDVCPLNFYPENRDAMWKAVRGIFDFWIDQGVKAFRIDNPHTKPTEFWEWLIRGIKAGHPEIVFLAEAFTNYDKLEELARAGFSQSYTYFTWRNGKNELIEYFSKLTGSYLQDFLRANLFTNTPDILPPIIQKGGVAAFRLRIALAATLSSAFGMYSGYELLENEPLPGREEYKDSEKYEIKVRDWNRPGNIKEYIARLNRIRSENRALQLYDNLRFRNSTDDNILFYSKADPGRSNLILVAVNLDPFAAHTGRVTVPVEEFDLASDESYQVRELITGKAWTWKGRENTLSLDPADNPAVILRVEKDPAE
jgi:starch synthase (maltosyl-transferring)